MDAWSVIDEQTRRAPSLRWSPAEPVVLVVDSEKGGVGKSALAGGMAAVLAAAGRRVLAIDLDPRGSLTAELDAEDAEFGVNDLLYSDGQQQVTGLAADAVHPAGGGWPADLVHVLRAERGLAHRETDVSVALEQRLRLALTGVAENYDATIIDVPPRAGGRLVGSALIAGTHVVVPATLDEDGYVGAADAMRSIRFIQESSPPLTLVGVVRNIVDRRTSLENLHDQKLQGEFGQDLLDIAIPKRIIRKESRSARVPITAAGAEAAPLTAAYTAVLNAVSESS